jgi:hypothetical protein
VPIIVGSPLKTFHSVPKRSRSQKTIKNGKISKGRGKFLIFLCLAFPLQNLCSYIRWNPQAQFKGGDIMKKIAIQLLIVAATVMAYVLPVLAEGGGS